MQSPVGFKCEDDAAGSQIVRGMDIVARSGLRGQYRFVAPLLIFAVINVLLYGFGRYQPGVVLPLSLLASFALVALNAWVNRRRWF